LDALEVPSTPALAILGLVLAASLIFLGVELLRIRRKGSAARRAEWIERMREISTADQLLPVKPKAEPAKPPTGSTGVRGVATAAGGPAPGACDLTSTVITVTMNEPGPSDPQPGTAADDTAPVAGPSPPAPAGEVTTSIIVHATPADADDVAKADRPNAAGRGS
jgi:hypothetical protein